MTLFESLSLAIAAGQMLVGAAGVVLVWVGVRQMIRANDARAERDGVLLESLGRANEALAELLRDRRQAGKEDAP